MLYCRGGLEIIELRHGKSVRTLIPKVAEGVFSNICMFTKTDAYVLYYHGGKNTLRVFRYTEALTIRRFLFFCLSAAMIDYWLYACSIIIIFD